MRRMIETPSRSARIYVLLSVLLLTASSSPGAGDAASDVIGTALVDGRAYARLAWLTDRIGHRLSGSEALERAIDWAVAEFKRDGIDRVWTEEVIVPHWVRGSIETASIVHPTRHRMTPLALGGSVPTPQGGITAEVVSVVSFDELRELGDAVRGKIVLFNKPILRNGGREDGYGSAAGMRVGGPSEAARLGAVATLIRSLGTADYNLPHTGAMHYKEDAPKIPAAAVAAEDAALIQRLLDGGETVRVQLEMDCKTLPDATSANVIADLPGRELPEEIVLIGGHLDSWDVGTGAHDDGAGIAIVMETMRLLRSLDRPPRRTVRAVLFTNEENGLRGGRDYAWRHREEMDRHVVAIESDSGGAAPLGFGVSAGEGAVTIVEEIAQHLAIIGADDVKSSGGGADISRMREYRVPQMGLRQDTTYYFDYHHTRADTLDKVEPHDLDRNVAAMAWMAYALAEREDPLPRPSLDEVTGTLESISMTTTDGVTLRGELGIPAAKSDSYPAVILIHQGGSDRSEWNELARKLLASRYAVLAYDVRGHGESDGVEDVRALFDDPDQAPLDLRAAIALLRSDERIDADRIAVVGSSIGSNLACVASAQMGIKTAVAISGKTSAVLNLAGDDALQLESVFHISSERDQDGKRAAWAEELYERTTAPRKLEIVEGSSAHGVSIFGDAPRLPERIVDWLRATL